MKRWRIRNQPVVEVTTGGGGTPSSISSGPNSKKSAATRTSERQKKRDRHGEELKSFIPAWLDHDKTIATLSRHP